MLAQEGVQYVGEGGEYYQLPTTDKSAFQLCMDIYHCMNKGTSNRMVNEQLEIVQMSGLEQQSAIAMQPLAGCSFAQL